MPKTERRVTVALYYALVEAKDHLEYCGYGDSWERECAVAAGLQEKIESAIKQAEVVLPGEEKNGEKEKDG